MEQGREHSSVCVCERGVKEVCVKEIKKSER